MKVFLKFWDCLDFSVNFRFNNVFVFFCTVWGQNKFEKNYIYFVGDCVEFFVYLVLILGVLVSVLILFLELGGLGVVLFLIFF